MTGSAVSVVITCRDEAQHIEELLEALRAQVLPPMETIVVDNGSTDGSAAIIDAYAKRHPEMALRVIPCARPGAAAAMNTGITAATGDLIVRIDGHSRPRPDYIRRAMDRLQEPKAGVVGGVWDIEPTADTVEGPRGHVLAHHPDGDCDRNQVRAGFEDMAPFNVPH